MKIVGATVALSFAAGSVIVGSLPAAADTYYGVTPDGRYMRMSLTQDRIKFVAVGNESRDCMKGKIKRARLPYEPQPQWKYTYYRVTKGKVLSFITTRPARVGNVTLVRSATNPDPNELYEINVKANKFYASYWSTTKQSFEKNFGGPLRFSQCGKFF